MSSEAYIQREIQVALGEDGHRLFRNNTAQGWVGESIKITRPTFIEVYPGDVVVRRGRVLHAGLVKGSSDLIGWTKVGKFCALEVKSARGSPSTEQRAFCEAVRGAGGVAGIARSVEEARAIIQGGDDGDDRFQGAR